MCGIAGIHHWPAADAERRAVLTRMTRTLQHRGPDDEGYLLDREVALGHRRLSIIDLASGHQPLSNEDGTRVDRLQRRDLQLPRSADAARSERPRLPHRNRIPKPSSMPTRNGARTCLERLRGMFAFAIWDRPPAAAVPGARPAGQEAALLRASWAALSSSARSSRRCSHFPVWTGASTCEAVSDYLSLLYIPAPKTIFRQVRKLPPGHFLLVAATVSASEPLLGRELCAVPADTPRPARAAGRAAAGVGARRGCAATCRSAPS